MYPVAETQRPVKSKYETLYEEEATNNTNLKGSVSKKEIMTLK